MGDLEIFFIAKILRFGGVLWEIQAGKVRDITEDYQARIPTPFFTKDLILEVTSGVDRSVLRVALVNKVTKGIQGFPVLGMGAPESHPPVGLGEV